MRFLSATFTRSENEHSVRGEYLDLGVVGQGYVIFGGSRGMGRAAAEVLAAERARLAIIGQDSSRLGGKGCFRVLKP